MELKTIRQLSGQRARRGQDCNERGREGDQEEEERGRVGRKGMCRRVGGRRDNQRDGAGGDEVAEMEKEVGIQRRR